MANNLTSKKVLGDEMGVEIYKADDLNEHYEMGIGLIFQPTETSLLILIFYGTIYATNPNVRKTGFFVDLGLGGFNAAHRQWNYVSTPDAYYIDINE